MSTKVDPEPAAGPGRSSTWRGKLASLGFQQPPGAYPPVQQAEEAARELAMSRVPTAMEVAAAGVTSGSHFGMQIYVSRHGDPQADAAIGWATAKSPMTTRSLVPWFCCMKPLYTLGVALLWEEGALDLWQPVSEVIPEFSGGGKETILFWHLLTHTAGIRPDPFYTAMWKPRDEFLDAIYRASIPPDAKPGRQAYYGQFWAWAILAEAIERRVGQPCHDYLRAEILEPLGIQDCYPIVNSSIWNSDGHRISPIYDIESHDSPRLFAATEHRWQYCAYVPGTVGIGSASALGRIGETLLPEPPRRIVRPQTASALTARHRVGLWDGHWRAFLSWGLGLIADGWIFGDRCSPQTVGHVGYNTSYILIDPIHSIVVAAIANGLCSHATSVARDRAVSDSIYDDLGVPSFADRAPQIVTVDPDVSNHHSACQAQAEARYWKANNSSDDALIGEDPP